MLEKEICPFAMFDMGNLKQFFDAIFEREE
jgi:hypothetical protein